MSRTVLVAAGMADSAAYGSAMPSWPMEHRAHTCSKKRPWFPMPPSASGVFMSVGSLEPGAALDSSALTSTSVGTSITSS